ncbi:MAG: hypothetical protein A2W98_00865 [Bacteroidetes bacterium GWF2_33_38]|nr:MAG: hypothetical protein A2W98_00865 [Bacteroidetes bacterium GWF2_33_38]OFY92351.1 MAG: hypothetical protein A2236_00855 [Bacteroidetes bacterium RIFOXYA2_FULL_33_7]
MFLNSIAQTKTSGNVSFAFTTQTANGEYSPKHVLAAWVTTSSGTYVKSLKVMAQERIQYLYAWKATSSSDKTDAITGATLNSHQTHNLSWNCKDLSGVDVADGDYKLWVEFTDKDGVGPKQSYTFTKGATLVSLNPADVTNFKSVSIQYTPATNDIASVSSENKYVTVFPNPFSEEVKIVVKDSENNKLYIYNTVGKLVSVLNSTSNTNGSIIFNWNAKNSENQEVAKGIYFYTYKSKKASYSGKLIYVK